MNIQRLFYYEHLARALRELRAVLERSRS